MSLKNVELQIALPRTIDQSRNQQIQQNQSNVQSAFAGQEQAKQSVQMEQTVMDTKDNARTELRDRQGQKRQGQEPGKRKHQTDEEMEATPHPYKGHRLDIKL